MSCAADFRLKMHLPTANAKMISGFSEAIGGQTPTNCRNGETPQELARMAPLSRQEYEAKFTPESNIRQIERIFEDALSAKLAS